MFFRPGLPRRNCCWESEQQGEGEEEEEGTRGGSRGFWLLSVVGRVAIVGLKLSQPLVPGSLVLVFSPLSSRSGVCRWRCPSWSRGVLLSPSPLPSRISSLSTSSSSSIGSSSCCTLGVGSDPTCQLTVEGEGEELLCGEQVFSPTLRLPSSLIQFSGWECWRLDCPGEKVFQLSTSPLPLLPWCLCSATGHIAAPSTSGEPLQSLDFIPSLVGNPWDSLLLLHPLPLAGEPRDQPPSSSSCL